MTRRYAGKFENPIAVSPTEAAVVCTKMPSEPQCSSSSYPVFETSPTSVRLRESNTCDKRLVCTSSWFPLFFQRRWRWQAPCLLLRWRTSRVPSAVGRKSVLDAHQSSDATYPVSTSQTEARGHCNRCLLLHLISSPLMGTTRSPSWRKKAPAF